MNVAATGAPAGGSAAGAGGLGNGPNTRQEAVIVSGAPFASRYQRLVRPVSSGAMPKRITSSKRSPASTRTLATSVETTGRNVEVRSCSSTASSRSCVVVSRPGPASACAPAVV